MKKFKVNHQSIIMDPKFDTVMLSVRILIPFRKSNVTMANIMTHLFDDRLIDVPTKKAMTAMMDELYGARFTSRHYSMGNLQIIEITLAGIHEKFTQDNLHLKYLNTLIKIITRPLINNDTLLEAKKSVAETLKREQEHPSELALKSAFTIAGENQIFGIDPNGYMEDLDEITVEDMIEFHNNCLFEFEREFYAIGDLKKDEFKLKLDFESKLSSVQNTHINKQIIEDKFTGDQSEIILVFETEINPYHPMYYSYLVFLALLGQGPTSYLFKNVREKHSLCYSIFASQFIFDGLFYIVTSVQIGNEHKAIELILDQIKSIEKDEIDLTETFKFIENRTIGILESMPQQLNLNFRNKRLGLDDSIDSLLNKYLNVGIDDIKIIASMIKDPLIYIYKGVDNEAD